MKKVLMFTYSIVAYLIGFASILYWIGSVSHLVPEISIDKEPGLPFFQALLINFGWVMLFGLQHSIMARKPVKKVLTKYLPRPIERSTFVLISGVLLVLLVSNWQPLGGLVWEIPGGSALYYISYFLFFSGWIILFVSSFLINHFDLFGLRQTYLELVNKPYTDLNFKVISLYKYVRHPLYFGGILGLWATPRMTVTHLVFAIGLTSYFVVGTLFEERDLKREFGELYKAYQAKTPMLIPFTKFRIKRTPSKQIIKREVTQRQ
jgi:protein-S-isoprenylcysteine O-methyltransferase Ste14